MRIGPQRPVNPDAIVAPQGYRVEPLITGLTFPSAISFGTGGELYLAEAGGVAGSVVAVPRVLRVDPDQSVSEIGRLENPIVGLVYREGELLIAEDGPAPRILRVTAEGEVKILVEGLPGGGDYGLSGLSQDANGALLFGLGTRTNSGVVGLDNVARGWVAQSPQHADIPGVDVQLTGINYVTSRTTPAGTARVTTGGFKPYSVRSEPGEKLGGAQRCGGAVYRLAPDASEPERVAWGLRNPVGVACSPDGRIFATEGGMEERGSRPIAGAPDNLWEIRPGEYYGWPDYASGIPVTEARFRLPGHPQPRPLLANAPAVKASPLTVFPARAGIGRLGFSTAEGFGFVGEAFVALTGEWSAAAYPGEDVAPSGYRVVRVDMRSGAVTDFLVNKQAAPSSAANNSGGLERPFDVAFDPTGEVLYVVDLGEVQLNREYGIEAFGGTGVVWRITRIRPMLLVSTPTAQSARPTPEPAPQEAAEELTAEQPVEPTPAEAEPEQPEPEATAAPEAPAEAVPAPEETPEAEAPAPSEAKGALEEMAAPAAEAEVAEVTGDAGGELVPEGEPAPAAPAAPEGAAEAAGSEAGTETGEAGAPAQNIVPAADDTAEEAGAVSAAAAEAAEAPAESAEPAPEEALEAPAEPAPAEPAAEAEASPEEPSPGQPTEEAVTADTEGEPTEPAEPTEPEAPIAEAGEPLAPAEEEPASRGETETNPAPGQEPEPPAQTE